MGLKLLSLPKIANGVKRLLSNVVRYSEYRRCMAMKDIRDDEENHHRNEIIATSRLRGIDKEITKSVLVHFL